MAMDWLRKSTPASPARGTGNGSGSPAINRGSGGGGSQSGGSGGNTTTPDGRLLVECRHIDWVEHQINWRWLLDSYEGGERYRNATYGPDRRGLPVRNLFRHKREYPDPQANPQAYQGFANYGGGGMSAETGAVNYGPYAGMVGADPGATAHDDDYEYRRSRTPVPEFVAEAVEIHLAKIFDQEIHREAPEDLTAWWTDVDGTGTPIDDWMRETIGPLLEVLGCLDIVLDHPKLPPGKKPPETRADELRLGLDKCVASYILPQNMVWWRLDTAGRYTECLVREYVDPSDRIDHDNGKPIDPDNEGQAGENWRRDYVRYRHWTAQESVLYSYDGDRILERVPHKFGRVPIIRLVDTPKHRTRHIGKSRYEAIAQYQREYYNRDSELILSDTLQAHPFLSGPEDFCKADNTLSIGPGYLLPKKKNPESGSYEGFEYISPPKDPAESLRKNKQDIIDMKDRRACLMKPAGASGGTGGGSGSSTVAQSGISKELDAVAGHKLLVAISKSLAQAERQIAEYALLVLRGSPPSPEERDAVKVVYPQRFDLSSLDDLMTNGINLQKFVTSVGSCPEIEGEILMTAVRLMLPGLTDETYAALDVEIETMIAAKATIKEQMATLQAAGFASGHESMEGRGSEELAGGQDPTGVTGATAVSDTAPNLMD